MERGSKPRRLAPSPSLSHVAISMFMEVLTGRHLRDDDDDASADAAAEIESIHL